MEVPTTTRIPGPDGVVAPKLLGDLVKLGAVASFLARGESPRRVLGIALSMILDLTGGQAALLWVDSRVLEALGSPRERNLGLIEVGEGKHLVARGRVADEIRDWEGSSAPIVSLAGTDMVIPGARGGVKILEPDCGALAEPGRVAMLHTLADLASGLADLAADQVDAERRADALEETRARFREQNILLRELAVVDDLTGLRNRRFFDGRLQYELDRFLRYPVPLALIVMDIDHFKQVNDTHGHPVGDEVLRQLARICTPLVRRVDLLARIGGEEFALLMPNTKLAGAEAVAVRLLNRIASSRFRVEQVELKVTVSMGLATAEPGWEGDPAQLFRAADQALYRAKLDGRNRVVVAMNSQ